MAKTLWASEICERALRKIGAFAINDSAANPEEVNEAAAWLDLIVDHRMQTEVITWLIEDTFTGSLIIDQISTNLETFMGTTFPDDGVLFIKEAYITDGTNDETIDIVRRKEYEDLSNKTASGRPELIYIDRLTGTNPFTFKTYPTLGVGTLSLKLVYQKGAPNLADDPGIKRHGMPTGWQFWMVEELAASIGKGPVRRVPVTEQDRNDASADRAFARLQASQNREVSGPRRVKAYG